MHLHQFAPDDIVVRERLRPLNPSAVDGLVESIKQIGLRVPLSVRLEPAPDDDVTPVLVAGQHRLEAVKRLGFRYVDCVEHDTATDARLWEIAENLHRAELTEAERRQHIAEWVRLTEDKVRHGGAPLPGGAQPKEQGIRKAAKELGLPETTVRRAVDAENLAPEAKAIADTEGLGTVARALVAKKAASKEAQIAALREEAEKKREAAERRREANALRDAEAAQARRENREADRVIADSVIEEIKEYLAARLDVTELDQLGRMLAGVCAPLAKALRREAA